LVTAAVDLYTCGDTTNTHKAAQFIGDSLKAKTVEEKELVDTVYNTVKLCIVNREYLDLMDKKPKLLWVGDVVATTGFARVTHNVVQRV
jgi:hypothetical protein